MAVAAADPEAVAALADKVSADLVVVGPEVPLVAGVVDAVEARGRLAFGPRAAAARLEGSKAWMKNVLSIAGVPTARYGAFTTGGQEAALRFLDTLSDLFVVKTDGLAAGKGVVVTTSRAEARDAVRAYLSGEAFGAAGKTIVIEEGLTGSELSLLVLCDGERAVPLAPAQDFKRIGDGDAGPNTGGMGAYSPVPAVGPELVDTVMERAVAPTLEALGRLGPTARAALAAPSAVPAVSRGTKISRSPGTSNRASCAASRIARPSSALAPDSGTSNATLVDPETAGAGAGAAMPAGGGPGSDCRGGTGAGTITGAQAASAAAARIRTGEADRAEHRRGTGDLRAGRERAART